MSQENLHQSLDSVERALQHFVASLERAGFKEGATAYQQMANVIIGQRLWANDKGIVEFDGRFQKVAVLAEEIRLNLAPYVEAMEKLRMIGELAEAPVIEDEESIAARVTRVLNDSDRPMSITAIRSAVGCSNAELKRELEELVEQSLVARVSKGSRRLYAATGRQEIGRKSTPAISK